MNMDAQTAQLIECFNGTGPLTYNEKEALLELFHRRGDRLPPDVKIAICELVKVPYEDIRKDLAREMNALGRAASVLSTSTVRLSPGQGDLVEELVKHADQIVDLVTRLY